jgi:non-specific serine/threonine protein kinase
MVKSQATPVIGMGNTPGFGLAQIGSTEILPLGATASKMDTMVGGGGGLTSPGSAVGTVLYMSPEQARGQLVDARTDLFSLGTVLYQMASGKTPFQADTSAVIFDAILNREPVPIVLENPAVPAQFGQILAKLLEKDRTLRCQSATELKTDLNRLKRDLESGNKQAANLTESKTGAAKLSPSTKWWRYFILKT